MTFRNGNGNGGDMASRISDRQARVAIMGLGYVGLPLAVAIAKAGFPVFGVDMDSRKVDSLRRGESYIGDVPSADISSLVQGGGLSPSDDFATLSQVDIIVICVPTPVQHNKAPDISYITAAARQISKHLRAGQLVILQSTTHPGTTEEDVRPILESSGLRAGTDFHLAFSPERINPGDKVYSIFNTPKVVGGITPMCGELASRLFAAIYARVHVVSSPRAAEMTKLLENIFRSVNIALVNELAMLCERMNMNVWEVIAAAATKPFGYMPFSPGPGVGGHCIPVDPFFLLAKAREYDFHTKFIQLAAEINESMPQHTVTKVVDALNSLGKALRGSRVLVLGVSYKMDVEDARNSPAGPIIKLLIEMGAEVAYSDPYVPRFRPGGEESSAGANGNYLHSVGLTDDRLGSADCVLILTPHSCFNIRSIVRQASLVVDACNATGGIEASNGKVFQLGVGHASPPTRVESRGLTWAAG